VPKTTLLHSSLSAVIKPLLH